MKKDNSKRGDQGSAKTGTSVRKEIRRLQKCMTNEQIGNRVGRSGSTISKIMSPRASGKHNRGIKRAPVSLLNSLKRVPSCKKK